MSRWLSPTYFRLQMPNTRSRNFRHSSQLVLCNKQLLCSNELSQAKSQLASVYDPNAEESCTNRTFGRRHQHDCTASGMFEQLPRRASPNHLYLYPQTFFETSDWGFTLAELYVGSSSTKIFAAILNTPFEYCSVGFSSKYLTMYYTHFGINKDVVKRDQQTLMTLIVWIDHANTKCSGLCNSWQCQSAPRLEWIDPWVSYHSISLSYGFGGGGFVRLCNRWYNTTCQDALLICQMSSWRKQRDRGLREKKKKKGRHEHRVAAWPNAVD